MRHLTVLGAALTLAGCSSQPDITPQNWTCDALVKPIIKMSQEKDAKILEITAVREIVNIPGSHISCDGNAEWSQGYGGIEFGARVTDGDNLVLEYSQQ